MPTILITGGSRGIGRALVQDYAAHGWDVIATARSEDDLAELNAMDKVEALELDVGEDESIDRFVEQLGDRPIDLFLNNAGIASIDADDRAGFLKTLEINAVAPTMLARRLKDHVAQSDQKKMAVVTSRMGSIGDNDGGGYIPYRASKAAVNAAWKSLAIDMKPDGIAIAMLHPGHVKTDMGGSGAPVTPADSASGLRKQIDETNLSNSGRFVGYDGAAIEW
ncbi:SDR family oxidoreductase [Novosphingopyxis sp.]|uniref:SDR family oxidoreductase n=1 Tax=Novosphingopyxis sp. TaxID=2709690 RepID=UPI003B5BC4FC